VPDTEYPEISGVEVRGIVEEISEGFRLLDGHDKTLERDVYVCVYDGGNYGRRKRFLGSARQLSRLTEHTFTRVHAIEESEELVYAVVEKATGQDIRMHVQSEGVMPLEVAVGVVRDLCNALYTAERKGTDLASAIRNEAVILDTSGRARIRTDRLLAGTMEDTSPCQYSAWVLRALIGLLTGSFEIPTSVDEKLESIVAGFAKTGEPTSQQLQVESAAAECRKGPVPLARLCKLLSS